MTQPTASGLDQFDPATFTVVEPRTFEDLKVGEIFRAPSRTLTDAHATVFQAVSADNHPIHYNVEYARSHGHTAPVVHGLQVLAFTAPGATQTLVRAGFRMILTSEPDLDLVGETGDGLDAAERAAELRPEVVPMDVRMPVLDGMESTRRITAVDKPPRVIVLTTFNRDEYVYEALRAGASAFLLKDAPEHQLLAAIRVAADGGSLFAPSVTRRLIELFTDASRPPQAPGLDELTARELEVLRLVARGLSNAEIAAELVVSEHTTKTHVVHVLMKPWAS
jgi:DNA-binding NarL/FixJ family response regulator